MMSVALRQSIDGPVLNFDLLTLQKSTALILNAEVLALIKEKTNRAFIRYTLGRVAVRPDLLLYQLLEIEHNNK